MTEQEYRERAARGEFLSAGERQTLHDVERLLYPAALRHWDLARCWCPLCEAWTATSRALLALEQADAAKAREAGQRRIVLEESPQ